MQAADLPSLDVSLPEQTPDIVYGAVQIVVAVYAHCYKHVLELSAGYEEGGRNTLTP